MKNKSALLVLLVFSLIGLIFYLLISNYNLHQKINTYNEVTNTSPQILLQDFELLLMLEEDILSSKGEEKLKLRETYNMLSEGTLLHANNVRLVMINDKQIYKEYSEIEQAILKTIYDFNVGKTDTELIKSKDTFEVQLKNLRSFIANIKKTHLKRI